MTKFENAELESISKNIDRERDDWKLIKQYKEVEARVGPYIEKVHTFNLDFKKRASI